MTHVREIAIAGLVILEVIALQRGIDGALFSVVIAIIAGLAGYSVRVVKEQ